MKKILCVLALSAATLSACSISQFPSYKLTVVQGNELDPRVLGMLQPGMSRAQVQNLLGTPLLLDPFHANRWDYTYVVTRSSKIREERTLTLTFNGDTLATAEGSALDYAKDHVQDNAPKGQVSASAPSVGSLAPDR